MGKWYAKSLKVDQMEIKMAAFGSLPMTKPAQIYMIG